MPSWQGCGTADLALSLLGMGPCNGKSTLKRLAVFCEVKLIPAIQPNDPTPRYLSKRSEKMHPNRFVHEMFMAALFRINTTWKQL